MGFFSRNNNSNDHLNSKNARGAGVEEENSEKETGGSAGPVAELSPPPLQLRSQTLQLQEMPEEEDMLQGKFQSAPISSGADQPFQLKSSGASGSGLPNQLKAGVENLSGFSMDDVKVHYNSSQPAQLQAHAFAQGTDIHIGPGQEQHLPHEAWHVAQQKQGRVNATTQMKGVNVNDDTALEKEADVMGAKAMQPLPFSLDNQPAQKKTNSFGSRVSQLFAKVVQMVKPRNKGEAQQKINQTGRYYRNGIVGGGKRFQNRERRLPTGSRRNPITYTEYDVNPYNGNRRDAERLVKGSDGRIWYTSNHYGSFTEIT